MARFVDPRLNILVCSSYVANNPGKRVWGAVLGLMFTGHVLLHSVTNHRLHLSLFEANM